MNFAMKHLLEFTMLNRLTTNNILYDTIISILILSVLPLLQDNVNFLEKAKILISFFKSKKSIKLVGRSTTNKYGILKHEFSDTLRALMWYINKNIDNIDNIEKMIEIIHSESFVDNSESRKYSSNLLPCQMKEIKLNNDISCDISIDNEHHDGTSEKNIYVNIYHNKNLEELVEYLSEIEKQYLKYIASNLNNKQMYFTTKDNIEDDEENYFNEYQFSTNASFNSIYFEKKDHLKKSLDDFLNNQDFYKKKGIPYRFTLLLHGEPGCGKTSIIKSIASYTKRHIINIRLNGMSKRVFDKLFYDNKLNRYTVDNDKRIYVIEEFDVNTIKNISSRDKSNNNSDKELLKKLLDEGQEKKEDTPKKNEKEINLSDILQALDGIIENPGRILIITTNKIDRIDKAILRPGRMDLTLNLKKANKDVIKNIYKNIIGKINEYIEIKLDKIPEYKYSPAEISNIFFYYRSDVEKGFDLLI